jgi:pimeloyl-ACP methyl ester carboxylesterase
MPTITSTDGTRHRHAVVFVHEFAGDCRTGEPQMRASSRSRRCVTFSARGYPPSEVPSDPARYGQDIARADVVAIMDALGIAKAHRAYTALHIGIHHPERRISVTAAGCGWGSVADPAAREAGVERQKISSLIFAT